MKYSLDEITIRVVDVAAQARNLYGDRAEELWGAPLPEHDFRFELEAENAERKTTLTCPQGFALTAEDVIKLMNR